MINREIPFRPRLEGEFRVRFYNAASEITEKTPTLTIARIAEREIEWVEKDCQYNIEQRKKYRAVWFLFRDLIRASWKACYRNGVIYMSLPTLNGTDMHDTTSPEVKALLRSWMSESRHERLVGYTDFINRMENPGTNKQSIAALIADGDELEKRIKRVHTGEIAIETAVQPYLQLVRENDRDVFTGLKTSEIWRYFRLTWSTPVETTPGRTMQYLIRDAAHPMHAVMGIASLENCAVQITCRDDYIGWNQKAFIERIVTVDNDRAKEEFKQLLVYLEDGIDGIDYSELCTAMVVKNPTDTDIQLLLDEASNAEQNRQQLLRNEVEGDVDDIEKSELGSISIDAERALYRRKRAEQLARLLSAKKAIRDLINAENFNEIWIDFCKSETGNSAIRSALVAQKTKHIGSSMMELNVCGAIPPYNEILGGKLVALLATSPQVIHDYKERYADKASEIASRLKGMPVCRPADLVYVGTTSLYYVGSSQYNRLKMPGSIFNTDFDIVWKKLGMTIGFGTMHIESQAWLHSSLDAQAISCYTEEKEISQESECDDENTFCVPGQYLPQPHGRVRDEGFGEEGRACLTIPYRIGGHQPGGDRQPGLSSGTAQAGGARDLLRLPRGAAAHESGLRQVRSADWHGQRQPAEYASHLRRRLCWQAAPPDGLYRPPPRCCRPVVHGRF